MHGRLFKGVLPTLGRLSASTCAIFQNFTVKSVFSCCNIFYIILVQCMTSISIRSEISGPRHVYSGLREIEEVIFFKCSLCETGQMGK